MIMVLMTINRHRMFRLTRVTHFLDMSLPTLTDTLTKLIWMFTNMKVTLGVNQSDEERPTDAENQPNAERPTDAENQPNAETPADAENTKGLANEHKSVCILRNHSTFFGDTRVVLFSFYFRMEERMFVQL